MLLFLPSIQPSFVVCFVFVFVDSILWPHWIFYVDTPRLSQVGTVCTLIFPVHGTVCSLPALAGNSSRAECEHACLARCISGNTKGPPVT